MCYSGFKICERPRMNGEPLRMNDERSRMVTKVHERPSNDNDPGHSSYIRPVKEIG